jgi:hypothetical protein
MDGYRDSTGGIPWVTVICVGIVIAPALFVARVLLFPRHSPKMEQVVCMSNLRQMGLGMLQYIQDNDEMLPPRQTHDQTGKLISWRVLTYPYIKSKSVYQCSSNPVADKNGNDIERDGFSRSYAVNSTQGERGSGPFSDKFATGLSLDKIDHPESVIAAVESTSAFNDFNVVFPDACAQKTNGNASPGNLFSGHQGMTNVLYCNGHVKAQRPAALLGTNGKLSNSWTTDGKSFSPADQEKAKNVLEFSEKQNPMANP